MYFGTSTGALLITLTSLNEMDRLKEAYINVDNKSIFSVNPLGGLFRKDTDINILNAIYRILRGKTSLGESGNLYKLLQQIYPESEFRRSIELGKKMFPCVVNYTKGHEEYACNTNTSYEKYMKYTLAAASVPIAMNLVDINGDLFLDGGILQHVPIQKAIDEGADEIDVIVLRPERVKLATWQPNNILDVLMRTIEIMDTQISDYNVIASSLVANDKQVKLRIRYTPYSLTDSTTDSLVFDKAKMLKWWEEGYKFGFLEGQSKKIIIEPTNNIK
jgi:predicted patatin/cPLA2 family phospholipase